jgi:TatD DNase family protein
LVETDAPFLSPVPKRGKPNEPARVALVGAAVAAARDVDETALAALTTSNARRLFGLDPA